MGLRDAAGHCQAALWKSRCPRFLGGPEGPTEPRVPAGSPAELNWALFKSNLETDPSGQNAAPRTECC